ncbi:N-acetylneuraminate synthase [Candidatus Pelagibacter sp.]|nr:N-acetylneuraminate synthase [Candidatus Pelagibacter sp.]
MKSNKIFIIAEAGVNHDGSIRKAFKLVDIAKKAGADAVKFQSFIASEEISTSAPKAKYQMNTTNPKESQLDMIRKLELSFNEQKKLKLYCDKLKIEFISSPFDIKSIHTLKKIGLKTVKIPSPEINNLPYLIEISKKFSKIILSTGMSNIKEVNKAIKILKKNKKKEISILHCISSYPTKLEHLNLNAIRTLKNNFNNKIGFSDHSIGTEGSLLAIASGAKIIEKHFTINRNLNGPDHKISLSPNQLNKLVKKIRYTEKIMGNGIKKPQICELENIKVVRKSIVANKIIKAGEKFTKKNITTKRPGTGISPMKWKNLLGKKSRYDYQKDEIIKKI